MLPAWDGQSHTRDRVDFALEGVIVSCGATIEWLKNQLGLFADSMETEAMARSVPDSNGVYLSVLEVGNKPSVIPCPGIGLSVPSGPRLFLSRPDFPFHERYI